MSDNRWIGLDSIKIGATALTSVGDYMPATFTTIQYVSPGSARLIIDMPDEKRLYTEESSIADIVYAIGERQAHIEFATKDTQLDNMALALGGTVAGTVYSYPTSEEALRERSVRARTTSVSGTAFEIDMPRGTLRANAELMMYNNDPEEGEIGFNVSMMKAITDGGTAVAPFKIRTV